MTIRGLRGYVIAGALVVAAVAAGLYTLHARSDVKVSPSAAKWEHKENWHQIRPGMNQQQIRDLLGEPTTSTSDPAFTQWTYGQGPKCGKAIFAGGMLRDWASPR